jgi:hypothetical protein
MVTLGKKHGSELEKGKVSDTEEKKDTEDSS